MFDDKNKLSGEVKYGYGIFSDRIVSVGGQEVKYGYGIFSDRIVSVGGQPVTYGHGMFSDHITNIGGQPVTYGHGMFSDHITNIGGQPVTYNLGNDKITHIGDRGNTFVSTPYQEFSEKVLTQRRCFSCGTTARSEAKFCRACGKELYNPVNGTSPSPQLPPKEAFENTYWPMVLIIGVIALLLFINSI